MYESPWTPFTFSHNPKTLHRYYPALLSGQDPRFRYRNPDSSNPGPRAGVTYHKSYLLLTSSCKRLTRLKHPQGRRLVNEAP